MRKLFISFEGGEGAGKSTQIQMLHDYLAVKGRPVVLVRDPGTTPISEKIREILKNKSNDNISARTEALLYFAARTQLIDEVIKPNLDSHKIVVSDRFSDSTFVYQGFANQLDMEMLKTIDSFVSSNIMPNLTFYLKIDAKQGLARKVAQEELDRIESKGLIYHNIVQEGYNNLANQDGGKRIVAIDATLPINEIHAIIISHVENFLNKIEV
ncbi:MAG: dTMP kinase [Defluviitaleaceae bacterium]|nr:dTMP kinase [Defluviitaleaceae bacterium]